MQWRKPNPKVSMAEVKANGKNPESIQTTDSLTEKEVLEKTAGKMVKPLKMKSCLFFSFQENEREHEVLGAPVKWYVNLRRQDNVPIVSHLRPGLPLVCLYSGSSEITIKVSALAVASSEAGWELVGGGESASKLGSGHILFHTSASMRVSASCCLQDSGCSSLLSK